MNGAATKSCRIARTSVNNLMTSEERGSLLFLIDSVRNAPVALEQLLKMARRLNCCASVDYLDYLDRLERAHNLSKECDKIKIELL